jgi:Tfp pilus assembly protein PilO
MGILVVLLLVAIALAVIAWLCYRAGRVDEADELADKRQQLEAEWRALEGARRVHDVFYRARQALREASDERSPRWPQ